MQIEFTGQGVEVTAALKANITEKFVHLNKRYPAIAEVHVILRIENVTQIVEANIHIEHTFINAKGEDKDMYSAIDDLIAKLESQLAKHKQRAEEKR